MRTIIAMAVFFLLFATVGVSSAEDWPRFRGPNGSGVVDGPPLPVSWSDSKNLAWKLKLPGPGSSSPIVVGERVYLTCYSGYGVGRSGNIESLKRHLVCVDAKTGAEIWSTALDSAQPEDRFSGIGIPEHGYASHTPACDGERVYAFFGKSGVAAFDLKGKQLWRVSVGTQSGRMRFGSSSSPILYDNAVIVTASEESESIRALDKETGKELWKAEASGLSATWGTPVIARTDNGEADVVIAVPFELWGLNAKTGKLRWYAETGVARNMCPSAVISEGIAYVVGGRNAASAAVRLGGKGDLTDSVLWTTRYGSYVPSPVAYKGRLYWVNDSGIAFCLNMKDGKLVYQKRLGESGRSSYYASLVASNDHLYAVSRRGGTFVFKAGEDFEEVARNRFESDRSDFNASPALSDGRIFLRSNEQLYCVKGTE